MILVYYICLGPNRSELLHCCIEPCFRAMQERDGLSTAAEGATRLRIKRQELLYKEEALSTLLTSRCGKLQAFLGGSGSLASLQSVS